MTTETRYTLVSDNGYTLITGTARGVVEHLSSIDKSLSGLHLTKKSKVYWKEGLSDKAAEV
jgi:hypothetical protein